MRSCCNDARGDLTFEDVSFKYELREMNLLSEVKRYGQISNVTAVLSGGETGPRQRQAVRTATKRRSAAAVRRAKPPSTTFRST